MTAETSTQLQALDWRTLLFAFEGRTRRSHFWTAWLTLMAIGLVPILGQIIALLMIWPHIAITVKRLHDMGHTGWLAVVPCTGPILATIFLMTFTIGSILFDSPAGGDPGSYPIIAVLAPISGLIGLLYVIAVVFVLWIGLTPGQDGSNHYGLDPKATL